MPSGATQDGWVMEERSDRMWSTGEGNGKPLQHSCLENPMNNMKGKKDATLKDELLRLVDAQYATGKEYRNSSRRKEEAEPIRNDAQLWMCLVVKVKSDAILLFTALGLLSITSHIHNWVLFLLWHHPFILSYFSTDFQ